MPYIVTENCQQCRFTDCVSVCPVDAFHGDDAMMYIDPDACIDCGACEPQCPVKAIFEDREAEKNPKHQPWIAINKDKCDPKKGNLPMFNQKQAALPTAERRKKELGF